MKKKGRGKGHKANRKRVHVRVPNTGTLHWRVAKSLTELATDKRHDVTFDFPQAKPIEKNWNQSIKKFLDEDQGDYLLNIDDDNPPCCNPLDLVQLDLDVVGLPTPVNVPNGSGLHSWTWNVYEWREEDKDFFFKAPGGHPLEECDAIGFGCILIKKRVLEALKDDQPVMRLWDKNGLEVMGCDLNFCVKARKAGFNVFVHWGYLCDHIKEVSIQKVMQDQVLIRRG